MRRQIRPHAYARRQRVVAARPFDQRVKTLAGEPGAGVFRSAQYDLLVTTLDQNVGQCFGQGLAARDGEQVFLILGARAFDQGVGIEPCGLREDRGGDLDGVIAGEQAQDLGRSDHDRTEPDREQSAGGLLDGRDQSHENVVDQVDLVFGVLLRTDQIQVGEMPQHDRATLVSAVRYGAIELLDEFEGSAHRPW